MKIFNKFKSIMPHVTVLAAEDIQLLRNNAETGNLEVIQKILKQKKFRIIPLPVEDILNLAFSKGNLDMINYLLTSEDAKEFHEVNLNRCFRSACMIGKLETVQNILNSDLIKKNITIENLGNFILNAAASGRNFEVINYLFSSNKFKQKLDLNLNNDIVFKNIFMFGTKEMLECLILDLKVPMTYHIQSFLNSSNNVQHKNCRKLFEIRALKTELESAPNANLGKTPKRLKL